MEAVVIGAGPYGLAVAAHLRQFGVRVRVFGQPMGTWQRNMPAGMFLKSTPRASNISAPQPGSTLADYCAHLGSPAMTDADVVPVDLFTRYGLWFQARHAPDVEQVEVTRVSPAGQAFDVELSSGEVVRSSTVVVASGHVAFAHVPSELLAAAPEGPSPEAAVSHSSQHAEFARYAGKRVAVVGSGQSAMESAVLLHEAGARVELIARADRLVWATAPDLAGKGWVRRLLKPDSELGPGWSHRTLTDAPGLVRFLPGRARLLLMDAVLGPSGSFWLRDRFEGAVTVRMGSSAVGATALPGGGARLQLATAGAGGEIVEADHVLAGTGYHIDVDRMAFLDHAIRAGIRRIGSAPVLGRTFDSSVPGLYFTGLAAAPTFGPYLRFVAGTRFAGPRIAGAIALAHGRAASRARRAL